MAQLEYKVTARQMRELGDRCNQLTEDVSELVALLQTKRVTLDPSEVSTDVFGSVNTLSLWMAELTKEMLVQLIGMTKQEQLKLQISMIKRST